MTDAFSMDRRALMGRVALLLGASALPADAFAAGGKAAAKKFLAAPQFATLSAIADTVIPATDTPGAVGVGVPRLIDGMLVNWASAQSREQIVGVIAQVDKLALDADKQGFAKLTPARRKELLVPFDKAALKPGPKPTEKLNALMAMMAGPPVMNPAWVKLKDLVITLYYSSEIAMTKEIIYEHVPGKWVPSLKITPGMRPSAGNGGPF
ncbi:MAG: gluconate 2-dehydrogenase subunit 3 family protein [Sphingomonadales bacterium]|nr:gluconate 2-dehydrogenase subunit 3 family protein [Sphingomonadales bacterium]